MKVCITKADMQEVGAREEQVRGLPHEAMAEHQNKNKNKSKKQGAFTALLQEAAIPASNLHTPRALGILYPNYVRMNKTKQHALGKR